MLISNAFLIKGYIKDKQWESPFFQNGCVYLTNKVVHLLCKIKYLGELTFAKNYRSKLHIFQLILRIFEIKSCRSCGTVYRRRVFQIWILKDLDQGQVICKQWKVSSRAEKIIRLTGILIMTIKDTFPQERQL